MTDDDGKIESVIVYLEMTAPPSAPPPPTPAGPLALICADPPTLSFYRYLYNTIGQPHLWWERRLISDEELSALVQGDNVDVFVFYVSGTPAGYFELAAHDGNEIDLAYFGLMPEFIGQGYGAYLLRVAIDEAWSRGPKRLTVNTCSLDHDNALPVYQKAGFEPYKRETRLIVDPQTLRPFANETSDTQ